MYEREPRYNAGLTGLELGIFSLFVRLRTRKKRGWTVGDVVDGEKWWGLGVGLRGVYMGFR